MSVTDNRKDSRFEMVVDGHCAWLDYVRGDATLTITHTDVPAPLGGQGVGSALVRHAVDAAKADSLRIISHCSFATAWMKRHGING